MFDDVLLHPACLPLALNIESADFPDGPDAA